MKKLHKKLNFPNIFYDWLLFIPGHRPLINTCQVDRTRFFAQTGKENTRMRMKIFIYFVNDDKVMQKQRGLTFDY